MNFLALVKEIFTVDEPIKSKLPLSVYKAPPQSRNVAPVRPSVSPKPYQATGTDDRAFGQLPRRIRRLKALALEGGYSNGAQIEGLKVSSLWAVAFVRLYDKSNLGQKQILELKSISQVFNFVNDCIDKGQV